MKLSLVEEKKRLDNFEKTIEKLHKEANELALKAESKQKFDLIKESNQKRKRAASFMEDVNSSKAKIQKLEKDLIDLDK